MSGLSREIGVAAISVVGQRVMSLVEEEYQRYFTATGQEGKSLRDARGELRLAQERLAAATAALQRQEQTAAGSQATGWSSLSWRGGEPRRKREADSARDRAEAAQAAGRLVATAQGVLNTNVQKAASARDSLAARQQADTGIRAADERAHPAGVGAFPARAPATRVGASRAHGGAPVWRSRKERQGGAHGRRESAAPTAAHPS